MKSLKKEVCSNVVFSKELGSIKYDYRYILNRDFTRKNNFDIIYSYPAGSLLPRVLHKEILDRWKELI